MLEVGKTYHHSRNGRRDAWKIVDQWSDDIFEGVHHSLKDEQGRRTAVLFNKSGKPIGAKSSRSYKPDFYLVEPGSYEYILLYVDGSISNTWRKVEEHSSIYLGATYVVREKGRNDTCRVLSPEEMKSFIKEL